MASRKFLIDTNVLIDYFSGRLIGSGKEFVSDCIENSPFISVISEMELLGYSMSPKESTFFNDFIKASHVIELERRIVNRTINIREDVKIKLPDAIIAASALEYNLSLATRNQKDFLKIKELECINLHEL